MAAISSLGSGSGLDLASLVDKLIAAEGSPTVARLDRTEARIQAKITGYGSLKGSLSAFQNSLVSLTQLSTFQQKSISTSSTTSLFSATASSSAIAGTYNVEVTSIAKTHSLATAAGVYTSVTDAVGTGTLTISFASFDYSSDAVSNVVSSPTKSAINITIDSSNNTLQGLRDAINNANGDVSASIVDNGTDFQLVITSKDTGKINSLLISVDEGTGNAPDNTDTTGLSRFAFNTSVTNIDNALDAADAGVKINGIAVTSASNTLTTAIEGVTLKLADVSASGVTVGVTVSDNTASTKLAINSFVKGFNDLTKILNSLTDVDVASKKVGVLTGDGSVRGIENQIRRLVTSSVSGLSGSIQSILDLGITTTSDGTLSIDDTKLQSAIDNNSNEISHLFSNIGVPTDSLVTYIGSTSSTLVGNYAVNITQAPTQGTTAAATAVTNLVIGSGNDNLEITVDGVKSGSITLTNQTYASYSDLAAEIQKQINADATLVAAGASVIVSVNTDTLVVTSSTYGSTSNAEFNLIENTTDLGLTLGTGTDGLDVVGTINGETATGVGQNLTGTGDAAGLQLLIGGASGSRGTVNYTAGLASDINDLINTFLGSSGIIEARTTGFAASVDNINEERASLNTHLISFEKRLIAQFSALDILVAQLQQTSNFLTQQLAALPKIGARN